MVASESPVSVARRSAKAPSVTSFPLAASSSRPPCSMTVVPLRSVSAARTLSNSRRWSGVSRIAHTAPESLTIHSICSALDVS